MFVCPQGEGVCLLLPTKGCAYWRGCAYFCSLGGVPTRWCVPTRGCAYFCLLGGVYLIENPPISDICIGRYASYWHAFLFTVLCCRIQEVPALLQENDTVFLHIWLVQEYARHLPYNIRSISDEMYTSITRKQWQPTVRS